jgi:hypothetical protein
MLKQSLNQSQKQSQKQKIFKFIPKDFIEDSFDEKDEEDSTYSYSILAEAYEINYETYKTKQRSPKFIGSIIKTESDYRFLYLDATFEKLDEIIRESFFGFEDITPEKLHAIIKTSSRGKSNGEYENIFTKINNASMYSIKLPNNLSLHLSHLTGCKGKDCKDKYVFRCFVRRLKKLLQDEDIELTSFGNGKDFFIDMAKREEDYEAIDSFKNETIQKFIDEIFGKLKERG